MISRSRWFPLYFPKVKGAKNTYSLVDNVWRILNPQSKIVNVLVGAKIFI
jgi:hypothetical protein